MSSINLHKIGQHCSFSCFYVWKVLKYDELKDCYLYVIAVKRK